MDTYRLPVDQNRIPNRSRSVALGVFDGVHLGHRAVITGANNTDAPCAVYTFSPDSLTTKAGAEQLCPDEFLEQLDTLGVCELFVADFAAVREMTPAAFVEQVLHDQLHATTVSCGFNYRFGKNGAGDAALLTALCAERGITVTVVPAVEVDGEPVSSTAIRRAIAAGDMTATRRLLGRNYCLRRPVVDGQHLGRRLGMPTINQTLPAGQACPRFGVYASCAIADGRVYPAVTNIGRRPTVGADAPLAETYIDGFSGDLYGQTVAVYPLVYLRPEQKFDSLEALQAQVQADTVAARALHTADTTGIKAVLFDFDDTLGSRDAAYERTLDAFLSRYYPGLSPAEQERRKREMILVNNFGYGMSMTYPEYIRHFLQTWEPVKDADPDEAYRLFFRDFALYYKVYEDAVATLTELRRRGFLLGVITNGWRQLQNQKLDRSGLRTLLDVALVAGAEGVDKPDREIFRRAAAKLGVPVENCLFVGDHRLNDVTGALNAGMQAVWMDARFPPDHPCLQYSLPQGVPTVTALSQLPELPCLQVPAHSG